jgi:antitoxin ParD1/3/4
MPAIDVSEELQAVIDAAVREGEYANAAEYIGRLVRQDQKRRAKEQLLASLSTDGDGVEALAEAWRKLRVERHRHSDDE